MSIKAQARLWEDSPHKGSDLLLLLALADWADDNGRGAYPSVPTLADKVRMTERNVQKLVRKLSNAGAITVRPNASPYKTNVYDVNLPPAGSRASDTKRKRARGGEIFSPPTEPGGANVGSPGGANAGSPLGANPSSPNPLDTSDRYVRPTPSPADAGAEAGPGAEGAGSGGEAAPPRPLADPAPVESGGGGRASEPAKVPPARESSHKALAERMLAIWNEHRGVLPAARQLNKRRIERARQHAAEFGEDAFLDLFEKAVRRVAALDKYREKRWGIDTLLGDPTYNASKVLKHGEVGAAPKRRDARADESARNWREGLE